MITEKERVVRVLKGWQFDRKQHGCLFDRGSADSYYALTAEEVAEYQAGYDYNERCGDKKDWR